MKRISLILFISLPCTIYSQEDTLVPTELPSVQTLILESGSCYEGECLYTFADEEGARISVNYIPGADSMMQKTDEGQLEIVPRYLDREYIVTFVLKKVYDEVTDLMMDDWIVSECRLKPLPQPKTEKMFLVVVDCVGNDCLFYFQNSAGDTLLTNAVPPQSLEMRDNKRGQLEVDPKYLNKSYSVKYTTRKVKDHSTDNYFDMLVLQELKPEK